jgi:hypothetical protein
VTPAVVMWKAPDGGDAFAHERAAAVDEAGVLGAVFEGLAGDLVVVGFVGLAQICGVGVGEGALLLHPVEGGAGVEAAGKGNANLLAEGQSFENYGHSDAGLNDASC